MKVITVLIALLAASSVFGAPCDTTGAGQTALEIAANGLSAGEWCEMTPAMLNFTEKANSIRDVLSACGGADNVGQYANNMAFDPSQGAAGKIGWWGTTHGGSHRFIVYDVGDNEFSVGPVVSGTCGTDSTCTTSWENSPVTPCKDCSAEHGYDGMATDRAGNFYHADFGEREIFKMTLPSTVNKSWKTCDGQYMRTGALDFWPENGVRGSLVALCGSSNNQIAFYDFDRGTWSNPFSAISWGGPDGNIHNQVNYNSGSGEVWVTEGNGPGTKHFRVWLNGGVPTRTQLGSTPTALGMTVIKAVDDPVHPSGKFITWKVTEDSVGTSSNGWREFNMGTDTWTTFAALGITSMPPLKSNPSDTGNMTVLSVSIPRYGVTVWLSAEVDVGDNVGGMFLYKHTDSGGTGGDDPPLPPGSPQPS